MRKMEIGILPRSRFFGSFLLTFPPVVELQLFVSTVLTQHIVNLHGSLPTRCREMVTGQEKNRALIDRWYRGCAICEVDGQAQRHSAIGISFALISATIAKRRKSMETVQTICLGCESETAKYVGAVDANSLAEAVSRYSPALFRIALRKLGNVEDAEDAVQDALLLAFKNIHQFRGESQFSTWLFSIVLNTARMQLRRRLNHKLVSLDVSDKQSEEGKPIWAEHLEDSAPDAEETFRQTQSREKLERVVEMLPFRLRVAFRMRAFDGLTTKEAATALGIPNGTLKTRFSRARTQVIAQVRQALKSSQKLRRAIPVDAVPGFEQRKDKTRA